ncbi:hypothetical protein [Brachybacterium sp. UMB0905]|uniref:hypothetical protein n=1 Tax=Brachybacterium sp. UMB0905 TaxID=2069310 RepID=UPI000C7FBB4F|nr:hypothetical protein [Brachybacterium sp. UMB0905]PMC74538.1 hypothetical protein CJ197_13165 [Brachybacterium sp. UMB0905]
MTSLTTRRAGLLLSLLTLLLAASLAGAPAAWACSCMGYDFDEAIEAADLIADIEIVEVIDDDQGDVTYYAAVDRVWKGEESRTIEFSTHEQTAACGLGRLSTGDRIRAWANGADGSYSMTWCAYPMDPPEDEAAALTEKLGEPADLTDQQIPPGPRGEDPELDDSPGSLSIAMVVGGAVLAAALGLILAVGAVTVVVLLVRRSNRRS